MCTKISQKLKIQTLATDTEEGGKVSTVLPVKATVLTRATEKKWTVCTVLPVKATVRTWASVEGQVAVKEI